MEPDILANPSEAPAPLGGVPRHEASSIDRSSPVAAFDAPLPRLAVDAGNGSRVNGHFRGNGHSAVALRSGHHHHAAMPEWAHGITGPFATVPNAAVAETLAAIDSRNQRGLYLRFGKRLLDIVGASVALVLSSPLLLIAAIAIKLESRGSIFYRSVRVGRDGRSFTFLKLRSMVRDADRDRHQFTHLNECDGPVFKISRDPRVTRVGRFLRTSSIDEIPQFLNVLRGEMSLVGPRPPIPEEVAQYEPWQLRRLDVLPGITCLWQISGRSRIGFQEWMRLDLEYIKHQSLALDLRIMVRTIPAVLSREGAY
jgi:lipopolysaccharide/colanic/teichoic acid biosynthesis glycosyltransferase